VNWFLRIAKAALPTMTWPRVKAAGRAAWSALRTGDAPTEPPRESAPEVSRDE
jgi:hypothetical protein